MTSGTLIQAAARELATVLGALLDAPGSTNVSGPAPAVRWPVSVAFSGPSSGQVVLGFDAAGAQTLARLVMAMETEADDAAVADTLIEVCGQAMGALSQADGYEGLRFAQATILSGAPQMESTNITLTAGDRFETTLAGWASLEAAKMAASTGLSPAQATATAFAAANTPVNLDLILDIELPLTVRFGETEMTLAALTRLAPGSIVDLGRSPDDPVDVLVNGRLVARADVVVVAGNYGVRIVEVISAADRLKTVAG
ncbi:MAG: flagellar motor switch protein FliN [Vicinamibacterales bacterium]